MDIASDTQAMHKRVICGHVFCLVAHGGEPPLGGNAFDELNIVKVAESMDKTMRLQLKLTPRKAILAIRTRVLTFCLRSATNSHSSDQRPLTRSAAFRFSVFSSCFSKSCSSLKVGLNGFANLAGVPGGFKALRNGEFGVRGTSTPAYDECLEAWLSET